MALALVPVAGIALQRRFAVRWATQDCFRTVAGNFLDIHTMEIVCEIRQSAESAVITVTAAAWTTDRYCPFILPDFPKK